MSQDVLAALKRRDLEPRSAELLVSPGLLVGPKAARHEAKGDALSPADWLSLPGRLRQPSVVLFDEESGRVIYILASPDGSSQLAVELDYFKSGRNAPPTSNMIISSYRPVMAEVMRRIANGKLTILSGALR